MRLVNVRANRRSDVVTDFRERAAVCRGEGVKADSVRRLVRCGAA